MKRLLSLLLSFILLTAPLPALSEASASPLTTEALLEHIVEGLADSFTSSTPGLSLTITEPNKEAISAGFGSTSSGLTAHLTTPDAGFLITERDAYLVDDASTVSVPLEALLNMLLESANGGQPLPALTPEDFQFLESFAKDFAASFLQSNAISWVISNSMINFHLDLDALLTQLDTVLPQLLQKYEAQVKPLLTQLTPILFGEDIPFEQLLSYWDSPFFSVTKTGLVLDGVLFQSGDATSLMASCMNWSLRADIADSSFTMSVTTPNGTVYPFSTADVMTLYGILSGVPTSITEEAFKIETTLSDKDYHGRIITEAISTTQITGDLSLIARDLVNGLSNALSVNRLTVDTLLSRYQPWINLFTGTRLDAEGNPLPPKAITTDFLIAELARLQFNEAIPLAATIVVDEYFRTTTVDGYLGSLLFEADLALSGRPSTISAAIRSADRYSNFELALTGSYDSYHQQYTLSSSHDLGGFYAITLSENWNYYESITALSTDTDVFHFTHETTRNAEHLDVKLEDFAFDYQWRYDNRSGAAISADASWPGGYANARMNVMRDMITMLELDSNLLGLSYAIDGGILRLDGYTSDSPIYMCPSRFAFLLDEDNELLSLTLSPYEDSATYITYRPGMFSILYDAEELLIRDAHTGTAAQNTTVVTFDGETVMTLVSTVHDNGDMTICVYPGADTTADCWQLALDFCASGMVPPTEATAVTPAEFINRLNSLLNPPAAEPETLENPVLAAPTEPLTP